MTTVRNAQTLVLRPTRSYLETAQRRYPEDKKDPVVAEYMKTGALQACDEVERRFFGDGREYVAGPEFTAAGECRWVAGKPC